MKDVDDILADYFAGEKLLPEEMHVLESWREQADHATLEEALRGMHGGNKLRESLRRDPSKGMRCIKRAIEARRRQIRRIYVSSAVACGVILSGIVLFYQEYQKPAVEIVKTEEFNKNSAVRLKLANGQEVNLHENQEVTIAEDSMSVIKNSNNTIICTSLTSVRRMEYNTLTVPVGAEYNLELPDGTRVCLNADSELRFPVAFSGDSREVYLKGEAYFEVAKDSLKQFKVHTADMTAIVLGTSFNVKAYPDQKNAVTTLEVGHLMVTCDNQKFDLHPGHQVSYNKQTRDAKMVKVDTRYYTSWKDGVYVFNEMPLEEIMEVLKKWYALEVFYVGDEVRKYQFSGRLKRYEDFGYLLEKFGETGVVKFDIKDKTVTIRKK